MHTEALSVEKIRVLFVGNSFTHQNNLPYLVSILAAANGTIIQYESFCLPVYSLEDHWQDGNVQQAIIDGNFDFVIIQQGPSVTKEEKESLQNFGKALKMLCDQHHAKLVYFMVWPSKSRLYDFDEVIATYTEAAKANNAMLVPVAKVWRSSLDEFPDLEIYGEDNIHPSLTGSLLAAMMILGVLLNDNALEFLDERSIKTNVDKTDVRKLLLLVRGELSRMN